jgi:hypothetical protein
MLLGRLLGWVLVLAAGAVAIRDAFHWVTSGELRLAAGGELWFTLAPESLNVAQAAVQRYLWPELWDPVIQTILLWPAVLVLLVPGLLLLMLCRRR